MKTAEQRRTSSQKFSDCDDGFDFDDDKCPIDVLVAKSLLSSVIQLDDYRLVTDGIAVVVLTPTIDWVEPIIEAWRLLAMEARKLDCQLVFGSAERIDSRANVSSQIDYFIIKRTGGSAQPNLENDPVSIILSCGVTVIGYATAPRLLPSNLLRSAEDIIVVPRPDWQTIVDAVKKLTGNAPNGDISLTDATCAVLMPQDFALAERPRQNANDFVQRLHRLVTREAVTNPDEPPFLEHISGMRDAVTWGLVLAQDLAAFRAGNLCWSDVDRGALLVGAPGTGKTTYVRSLARTCERECGTEVLLVSASYAKWQSKGHLGDFLKALYSDFHLARSQTPSILFIDEIDSFGDRSNLKDHNAEYCRATMNALLELLDGSTSRVGVVVLAATNNAEVIDKALLRPGRLDRIIHIPLPDVEALVGIFMHHLRGDRIEGNLVGAAMAAAGATGAQVEQWCRSARRRARRERRNVNVTDLMAEIGLTRGPRLCTADLKRAAVHEAGHAYVAVTERIGRLEYVSLSRNGNVGGTTVMHIGTSAMTRDIANSLICQGLAGRAAEQVLLGEASSASGGPEDSDIARVTHLAVCALTSYGLVGDAPMLWRGPPDMRLTTKILADQAEVAAHVQHLITEAHARAAQIIERGRRPVAAIAAALRRHEMLTGYEVVSLIKRHKQRRSNAKLAEVDDALILTS